MGVKKGLRRLKKGKRQQERYGRLKESEQKEVGVVVKCLITHDGRNKWVKGRRVGNTLLFANEKYNGSIKERLPFIGRMKI